MRICILEGDMSRSGGTERMAAWLANALSADHEVHILSLRLAGGSVFYPLAGDVRHQTVPDFPGRLGIFRQIRWIRRYLGEKEIHRVVNVDMGMGFYGILAAKKQKVITWEHGNFYNNWGSRLFPYFRRFAAKKSDYVVVLTEKDRENYEKNIKGCAPVRVIPNPAQSRDFAYDSESKTVLSVGHLLRNKGYHRVVELAKRVLPDRPDWNWVICGEGPERANLEKAILEAGLEGRVLLPGLTKDMDSQYRKAAMLVLTSDMEGLPMTLLEGKNWGLPLLAFDIMTGPSDIIDDGLNGFLVPPFDLDRMAAKLSALMDDAALRQTFSANSVTGMEKFSEKQILDQWRKLLEEE